MTDSPKRLTDEEFDRETAWAQRQLEGGCDYPLWLEDECIRARAGEATALDCLERVFDSTAVLNHLDLDAIDQIASALKKAGRR